MMSQITKEAFRAKQLSSPGCDKGHEAIFSAVGKALNAWENCERSFALIFARLVHPTGSGFAAQRAYGAIVPTGTKRSMIDSASEIFFRNFPNEAAETELKTVLDIYQAAANCRNNIAHGIGGGDQDDAGETWSFLVPNTWGSKSRDMRLQIAYRYSSQQIKEFEAGFIALSGRAYRLVEVLIETYRKAPEGARAPY
jgi:hypothetical protein